MGFNKDQAIIAQNSATAAATVVAALVNTSQVDSDSVLDAFEAIRTAIFEGSLNLAGGTPTASAGGGGGSKSRSFGGGGGNSNDSGAGVVIKFGNKHKGETIEEVYGTDPDYITWLAESSTNDFMRNKCQEFLASVS